MKLPKIKINDNTLVNIFVTVIVVAGIGILFTALYFFFYFVWYLYIHDIVKYLHFPYIPFYPFVGIFGFAVWVLNVIKSNLFPNKKEVKK